MVDVQHITTTPTATRDPVEVHAATRPARIALAHDWLCGLRGGEAVLERIAALVERDHVGAPLYTMFDDRRALSPAVDALQHATSPLNSIPFGATRLRRWLLPLYPSAVDALSRRLARDHARTPIDLLVSTSSAAIKGLRPPRAVPHLCYCHAPARYVWSQRDEYAGGLRALGLRAFAQRFKDWDRRTASNVTRFLANSTATRDRIRDAFDRDADVVHPPVRTGFFKPDSSVERGDYWLVVSAIEPYKRVDLAIEAARIAGARIVVAGTGSLENQLRKQSGAHAEFVGRVDDGTLRDLYRKAALFVFPQIEDFGITAVEAQACGTPVLARHAGGALDTVTPTTGVLVDSDEPSEFARAAARTPTDADACRASALRFSEDRFDSTVRAHIDDLL
jgi:glycosyltransferase involved in cell wall biosynthesis